MPIWHIWPHMNNILYYWCMVLLWYTEILFRPTNLCQGIPILVYFSVHLTYIITNRHNGKCEMSNISQSLVFLSQKKKKGRGRRITYLRNLWLLTFYIIKLYGIGFPLQRRMFIYDIVEKIINFLEIPQQRNEEQKMRMQLICDNEIIYLWHNCINECI